MIKYVHSLIRVSKVRTNTLVSTYVKKAVRVSVTGVSLHDVRYMLLAAVFVYHVIPVVSPARGQNFRVRCSREYSAIPA